MLSSYNVDRVSLFTVKACSLSTDLTISSRKMPALPPSIVSFVDTFLTSYFVIVYLTIMWANCLSFLAQNIANTSLTQPLRHVSGTGISVRYTLWHRHQTFEVNGFLCDVGNFTRCNYPLLTTVTSILETVHTAFFIHATYLYNVASFGNPTRFQFIPW